MKRNNKYELSGMNQIINDTIIKKEELDSEHMTVVNALRIQLQIKEISKSVTDDGFDTREVDEETLETLGILVTKLGSYANDLDLEDLSEWCSEAQYEVIRAIENLDSIQSNNPIDKMGHNKYIVTTFGLKNDLQRLYTFKLREVAEQMI